MKIIVFGGTGLIGTKVVHKLSKLGHEPIAASPQSGVNAVTGEGLAEVLRNADISVDVMNSPSFEAEPVMEFFRKTSSNILAAAADASVKHHVALSVVGTDRLQAVPYFRAKLAQENLIKSAGIPYSIVRATQFFEFLGSIAESYAQNGVVRVSPARMKPMAAADVSSAVVDRVLAPPLNGIADIAGPEEMGIDEAVRRYLAFHRDPRSIVSDESTGYFGAMIESTALTPLGDARLGGISLESWLQETNKKTA